MRNVFPESAMRALVTLLLWILPDVLPRFLQAAMFRCPDFLYAVRQRMMPTCASVPTNTVHNEAYAES
jgi:hypothetical protein